MGVYLRTSRSTGISVPWIVMLVLWPFIAIFWVGYAVVFVTVVLPYRAIKAHREQKAAGRPVA